MSHLSPDVRYKKLCTEKNLKLAWDRISTSTSNLYYKNYYRRLFSLYRIDLESNIEALSFRLKNYTYKPSKAFKFYKPKENGLLRPFTFISVEDQIVYQAMANILVLDAYKKRKPIESKYVFSNILCDNPKTDIFLFKKWKDGYIAYKKNVIKNFNSGLTYTAHFDLAAFYDTIDHHSLTCAFIKNINTMFSNKLSDWLSSWSNTSTESDSRKIHHSLPQGPLASSVFAELYLLPVDNKLIENGITYSRYVDDIIIQGQTELEVKKAVVLLDKICKDKGLVPQTSKFKIFNATSGDEAIGKKPSIDSHEKRMLSNSDTAVLNSFEKAISEDQFDGTLVRYILKSYHDNDCLVPSILENFNKHYELADDFCSYLKFFSDSKIYIYKQKFEYQLLHDEIPYDFVKKEIWELFSVMNTIGFKSTQLTAYAQELVKNSQTSPECRYGIYCYLSTATNGKCINFLTYEKSSLLSSLLIKFITPEIIADSDFKYFLPELKKSKYFPDIQRHIENFLIMDELNSEVYESLNLPPIQQMKTETLSYYLKNDYEIKTSVNLKRILNLDYEQINKLIYYIHIYYKNDKTAWINMIDTFCDVMLKALIPNFQNWIPTPNGWPQLTDRNGKPKEYGKILNELKNKNLIPTIRENLELIHKRRCSTPLSHPKDFTTMRISTLLSSSESYHYLDVFKNYLKEIISYIQKYQIMNEDQQTD